MPSHRNNLLLATLAATAQSQYVLGNYSTISNTTSSACPAPGTAHVIVARASTEPLGYGIIGVVKDLVLKALPGSNAEYVVYPATLTDYFASESSGVSGMKDLVEAYQSKNCGAPIVLMGYSQGAHVVADYLSGQNVDNFPYNATLAEPASQEVLDNVAAVTIMGDPSINITNNAYHVGNSTKSGLFPRLANSTAVLDSISGKIQSYCDELDPYCASAGTFEFIRVHLGYVDEYGLAASDFAVKQVKAWYEQNGGSGSGSANGTMGMPSATQSGNGATYTGAAASIVAASGLTAMTIAVGSLVLAGL